MRKRISERNILPNFDLHAEYQKIEDLLSRRYTVSEVKSGSRRYYSDPSLSMEDLVATDFLGWELRGTFITLEEMREELGIARHVFYQNNFSEEVFLDFIQYTANCVQRARILAKQYALKLPETYPAALMDNMEAVLSHLGAEFSADNESGEIFVCYSNEISDVIAETHPDIERSLMEYRSIDNQGNLHRKEEILSTLYKKFESIRSALKNAGFDALQSDTGLLLNVVRHTPKCNIAKQFAEMNNDEKERWYDKTYELFLACLAVYPYINVKSDINQLKKLEA